MTHQTNAGRKLKWRTDSQGNVFDIRDGNATFIITKKHIAKGVRGVELRFKFFSDRASIPFKYMTTAKKVAQLIHNG